MRSLVNSIRPWAYLSWPNRLSLLRLLLVGPFVVLMQNHQRHPALRYAALGIFVLMAVSDFLDGFLARRMHGSSRLGSILDPLADKVLVASALISFVALGYVSPLPVMLIIGREFLITGVRLLVAYRGVVIMPSLWAKVKTFAQMTVVGVVLAYINLQSILEHFDSPMVAFLRFDYVLVFNIMLWITAAVTVWTGVGYVVRYSCMIKTVLR